MALDLLALAGAQWLAVLAGKRKLVGWNDLPGAVVDDLYVVAIFLLVVGPALFVARRSAAYPVVLAAGALVATLHCMLLAVNVASVQVIGGPLTWQWIAMSDYFRGATPWRSASAAVTLEGMVLIALFAALPLLGVATARALLRFVPSFPKMPIHVLLATVLVAAPVMERLAPHRDPRGIDVGSSPAHVLLRSWFRQPGSLLSVFPPGEPQGFYARRPASEVAAPADPRANIVLVVLESVGRKNLLDHLDELPTLSALIEGGTWFAQASVTSPQSTRTNFEISTSNYPLLGTEPETTALADRKFATLFGQMEKGGYATRFFMSGDFAYDAVGSFHARQGFSGLTDMTGIVCADRTYTARRTFWTGLDYVTDDCTFRAAAEWVARQRSPWFVTVWTGETHYPYTMRRNAASRTKEAYVAALRESDRALGAFIARIASAGGPPPVLVVVGDHGEAFGEHGFNVHSNSVFEEEIGIPLIAVGGPFAPGLVRQDLTGAVDLAPTILDLAGLPRPAGWQGLSLLPHERPESARRAYTMHFAANQEPQVGLRTRATKYVYEIGRGRMLEYDLATDPDELAPSVVRGTRRNEIGRQMSSWVAYNQR